MPEVVRVLMSFEKYVDVNRSEDFSSSFIMDEGATYHVVLEKVELLLRAMGYEFHGHLDFTSNNNAHNVVQLHPEE